MLRWAAMILGLLGTMATPAYGMGFYCVGRPTTLCSDVRQASLVFYGILGDRERTADGKPCPDNERTYLEVLQVIKSAPGFEGKSFYPLNRYIPINDAKNPAKFLVFCGVYEGKIDPYRGIPATALTVMYLKGALAIDPRDRSARLRYFFEHLSSSDSVVAADAFQELDDATYAEQRTLAAKLSADEIVPMLQNPKIAIRCRNLLALLLGHCGKAEHGDLIRPLLDDMKSLESAAIDRAGIDRALIGYVLLRPKDGKAYLRDLIKDPSTDIWRRVTALLALRFFWSKRPDVIPKQEVLAGVCQLLDHNDLAYLAIRTLRQWKRWERLEQILGFFGKETLDGEILRFALSCPGKKAAAFVESARKKDAVWVKEVEELLRFESPRAK